MSVVARGRRFGVEEEFLLVDPETGRPRAVVTRVVAASAPPEDSGGEESPAPGQIEPELQQEQVEIDTAAVMTLDDLRAEIRRWRSSAAAAAESTGAVLAALATSPIDAEPSTTPVTRYERMVELYRLTASEQLTCGMHVHVQTASPEEAVGALDRVRPWLPTILALTGNSPYWQGADSGYESFRYQAWSRWPIAGPTEIFGSPATYYDVILSSLATEGLLDEGMVYFDARLGREVPTLEVRVADVCLDAEDAVLVAALVRALVDTAARAWSAGEPPMPVRTEVLRLASWRASRSGMTEQLVDPITGTPRPAFEVVDTLCAHVRGSLEDAGDVDVVRDLVGALRGRGTGATAQRASYARRESLVDVVLDAARRTVPSGS